MSNLDDYIKSLEARVGFGVDGAGNMGITIVTMLTAAGIPVTVYDINEKQRVEVRTKVKEKLSIQSAYGLYAPDDIRDAVKRVSVVDNMEGLAECPVIIEAVAEDCEVKSQVFRQLSEIVDPNAILLTNTSSLNPYRFGEGIENPDRFAVAHYLKPADVALLVEVGPATKYTPDDLVKALMKFHSDIGKHPVHVKSYPWLINPIQFSLFDAAMGLLKNGATAKDVDDTVKICSKSWLDYGAFSNTYPLITEGNDSYIIPLWDSVISRAKTLREQKVASEEDIDYTVKSLAGRWTILGVLGGADAGGLPVFEKIYKILAEHLGLKNTYPELLSHHVKAGSYGWSTYSGFHEYTPEKIEILNGKLYELLAKEKGKII